MFGQRTSLVDWLLKHTQQVFTYLDVGAREDVASPWDRFPKGRLKVVGFEPDDDEVVRLNSNHPDRIYLPYALGTEATNGQLYLTRIPSMSSCHRPISDESITSFVERHWKDRIAYTVEPIKITPLDALEVPPADFVKIDTQGAEYDIIRGAKAYLEKHPTLLTAETWCYPVYECAAPYYEVAQLLASYGYELLDCERAAAWWYQPKLHDFQFQKSRPRLIGLEMLFVPGKDLFKNLGTSEKIRHLALLDLYGYRHLCVHLFDENREELTEIAPGIDYISSLRQSSYRLDIFTSRLTKRFPWMKKLGLVPRLPLLH